jgi:RNA polymerase sigma-70 factor (ECF subfamily)
LTDNDSELVERCRRGDELAWRELVERHARRVFGVAYRFAGRVDEAEDLTQDVFVKVYQSLGRYEPAQGAFASWLTTVARNQAIDHYRRRREEHRRTTESPELLEAMPAGGESPEGQVQRQERAQLVRRGVRNLPSELREALVLCDLRGLSYEEAAAALGVPLGTIKSRINRARLELARRLLGRRADLGFA